MTALRTLWHATKADALVALLLKARSSGAMSNTNALSLRLVRLQSNNGGSRVASCPSYANFATHFNNYVAGGELTAAGQTKFFINGEIEAAFRLLTSMNTAGLNRGNAGVVGHYILNQTRTRVKEFIITSSNGGATHAVCRWVQANAASPFEIV